MNDAVTSAAAGTGLPSSAPPSSAAVDEAAGASIAEPNTDPPADEVFELGGWKLESFAKQTGHAVGRAATIGDLQICVTVGETDGSELATIPDRVLTWLMTGEAKETT